MLHLNYPTLSGFVSRLFHAGAPSLASNHCRRLSSLSPGRAVGTYDVSSGPGYPPSEPRQPLAPTILTLRRCEASKRSE